MTDQLLKEILETIRGSKEFVLAQAPDVIQQMILSARVTLALIMFVCFSVAVISSIVFTHGRKAHKEDGWDGGGYMAFGCFFGIMSVVMFFAALCDAINVWIAPKVYLLQELRHLIKN